MVKRVLIPTLIILIFLGGLLFVSFQTGIPQIFWKAQKQRENITQKPKHSPLVTKFYQRAQNDLTPEGLGFSTQQYVSKLEPDEQVKIARAIVDDPDERFSSFGVSLLIELGYEDETVPKLAKWVAGGGDLTRFFWAWIHSGDSSLADRMLVKVRHYLLDHLEEFGEEERKRIDLLLRQDGFGDPVPPQQDGR